MASRLLLPESELCCPVCCDIFREPVVLRCSHSFCKACLLTYWGKRTANRECPLCRSHVEAEEELVVSLTLRNLCEALLEEPGGQPLASPTGVAAEMCCLHSEPLKLFCQEDKVPICVVCYTSSLHRHHECAPIEEAVLHCKVELQFLLNELQEKHESISNVKQSCESMLHHIKSQSKKTERVIRDQFEKLHAFLRDEEASRIHALKEEEEMKRCVLEERMKEISLQLTSLSDSIRKLVEELDDDDLTVLQSYRTTMIRVNDPSQTSQSIPTGALLDVATHLSSLRYRVWEKMLEVVLYSPVSLDPNTAAPWLVVSDDLTSVSEGQQRQPLPNNPERFDPDAGVLGAEGFVSGSHSWDVEVGDNTAWVVGVAKESVDRKKKLPSVLGNGYLAIFYYQSLYVAGSSPVTRLGLKKKPQRIRVQLDCDRGRVGFYDPSDMSHIYTFKSSLTEKVFPYIWLGCSLCPMRIVPVDVSVTPAQLVKSGGWF